MRQAGQRGANCRWRSSASGRHLVVVVVVGTRDWSSNVLKLAGTRHLYSSTPRRLLQMSAVQGEEREADLKLSTAMVAVYVEYIVGAVVQYAHKINKKRLSGDWRS